MKVLLIHCPALFREPGSERVITTDIRILPAGLVAMANYLRASGIPADVVHIGTEIEIEPSFQIERLLAETKYDLVGVSIHWHKQINASLEVARRIKDAHPDVFLVLGGYTASFFAREFLTDFKFLDGVIQGDGELPLLRLAEELSKLQPELRAVPNLLWRSKRIVVENVGRYVATADDLDKLDFGDFRVLRHYTAYAAIDSPDSSYGDHKSIFYVVNGRGCPYLCSFCGGSREAQKIIHHREGFVIQSPETVLQTIKQAMRLGWKNFYVCFDPLPAGDYYGRLFSMIRREGLDISLGFGSWGLPARSLIDDLATSCRQSWVELSPETYSERVRRLNKGFYYTNAELNSTVEYLVEKNVGVHLFFGYFLPFETLDEIIDTLAYMLSMREKHRRLVETFFIPYSLDPGSQQYLHPERYQLWTQVKGLRGYIRSIARYGRMGNTENMMLSRPMHFTPRQALSIHHLAQAAWYLDNVYPLSSILLRKSFLGGYAEMLERLYSWLEVRGGKRYAIRADATRWMMGKLAENSGIGSASIKKLIAYEFASYLNRPS